MPAAVRTSSSVATSSRKNTASSAVRRVQQEKVGHRLLCLTSLVCQCPAERGATVSSLCPAAVVLQPCRGAETFVNGSRATGPTVLSSGRYGSHVLRGAASTLEPVVPRVHIKAVASSWARATCSASSSPLRPGPRGPRARPRAGASLWTGPLPRESCWTSRAST